MFIKISGLESWQVCLVWFSIRFCAAEKKYRNPGRTCSTPCLPFGPSCPYFHDLLIDLIHPCPGLTDNNTHTVRKGHPMFDSVLQRNETKPKQTKPKRHLRFFLLLLLLLQGRLLSWGSGQRGQLGLGDGVVDWRTPRVIRALAGMPVKSVAAGAAHTLCLTLDGKVPTHAFVVNRCHGEGRVFSCAAAGGYRLLS